jgi:SAM-dependent methyltransferase
MYPGRPFSRAIDMARRFPHASVLGIDLSPHTPNPDTDPPNVQFQVYDINHGMEKFYNQFDVIQMRCVASGIKSIDKTIGELLRSLKPGGFLTIIDGDRHVNKDRSRYLEIMEVEGDEGSNASVSKNGSWFERQTFGMLYTYSSI